ncbi:MAG: YhbY family RNA-binding protein [Cardiobacteriaceae bacterium]|nr:YhbY family RNA-binding protein [Cardiobacteriaceae bacterium]
MLSKNQIRFLKAQAHHLQPVVLIGAQGTSEGVDREINLALDSHELIKIKLGNLDDEIQDNMITHIINTHAAELIQKIGHSAIFYRQNAKNPKILLPNV